MKPLPSYGLMPQGAFASKPIPSHQTHKTDLSNTCAHLSLESLQTLGVLVFTTLLLGRIFGKSSAIQILTRISEARLNVLIWTFGAVYEWQSRSPIPGCDWCGIVKCALVVGLAWYQFWDDLWSARPKRASIMENETIEFRSARKLKRRSSAEHIKALIAIYHGLDVDERSP